MTKKITSAILALAMLLMTACGDSSLADTSKADTTTTAVEQDNSEIDSSSDSEETTTTTAETTTTTSDTSKKEEKSSDTTTTSATTTTAKAQATTTTTKQAAVTTKATVKPVQTTKATVKVTAKATTKATVKTTPKPTQPAANKSALDLAYEAVILGTSTKAQRDMICNDLNNYVITKGYSKKLDKSLYALSDANGKPTEDITKAVGWGNSGYESGTANDTFTTSYRLGTSTLEKAREDYKAKLKAHIDCDCTNWVKMFKRSFATYRYNVVMYKDQHYAEQRADLYNKYKTPCYVMVVCYA